MSEKSAANVLGRPLRIKITAGVIAVLAAFIILLGMYWSRTPDIFWVNKFVDNDRTVIGYSTTDTLIRVAETLELGRGSHTPRAPPVAPPKDLLCIFWKD